MTGSQGVQVDVALDLQMLDAVRVIQDLLGELDAHLGEVVKALAGVEEVAQLIGLNDIFSSLLKSAGYLLAQVTKDKVHLYDHSGRNFIDVLISIKLNLMATILGIATNGPSVASPSPPLTKEMVKYFFFIIYYP